MQNKSVILLQGIHSHSRQPLQLYYSAGITLDANAVPFFYDDRSVDLDKKHTLSR